MSFYEKIGKLIKQNKLYEKYNFCSSESINLDKIISDLLLTNNIDYQKMLSSTILNNNKLFSQSDFAEAKKLICECSREGQLLLIAILEIQLNLVGNENNYIKYEKINQKIIEKNIYWVISKEIHERIHREKKEKEFDEYCHFMNDPKEKYILSKEYNFKYENIDSIIFKLKNTNKNIEFIAIKSIFISFYNIACEYIQKFVEINEYNKKNNICEYTIFKYIINDYKYISKNIKFLNIDFMQSLNDFKKKFNIFFIFEDLFKDIFFNAIFHNQILGCLYIHSLVSHDSNIKKSFLTILNIINSQHIPLNKHLLKILNIENLFNFQIDLTSKIIEKNEQMNISMGIHSTGKEYDIKEEDEKNNESMTEKEVICINGDLNINENNKFNLISNINPFNMENIFLGIEKKGNEYIPTFQDDVSSNNIDGTLIINENNNNSNNNMDENLNINNENNCYNNNINNNEKMNMENKSLDEIYEYISKDNKVKNKKKNKKRNKGKSKKNNINNNEIINNEADTNDIEDPIVVQFKKDITEKVIFADTIKKIKPSISENWIKALSSY